MKRLWSLGGLLREQRLRAGLGQLELARRAGVSVRALRNLEQQRVVRPRKDSVRRLVEALDIPPAERDRLLTMVDGSVDTTLNVDVLGRLVVRKGSLAVDPGTVMCRQLFGALALRPRTAVSQDELVSLLWDDRPPPTYANLLHVYVRSLRTVLEPARAPRTPSKVIVRARDGYLLAVEDDQVDLAVFDRIVAEARLLPPEEALRRYEAALALWRGPVLEDANERLRRHPAAVAASRRRIAAVIAAADLAVRQGLAARAVTWLRAALDEEPLHEGLHVRLIVALARIGEQVAALRHYADLRKTLAEELGVEPDAEVQAAYLGVLRQEHRPAPRVEPDARLVPEQLPGDPTVSAGRAEELGALHAAQDARVIVIDGGAGVGKPNPEIWHNLHVTY